MELLKVLWSVCFLMCGSVVPVEGRRLCDLLIQLCGRLILAVLVRYILGIDASYSLVRQGFSSSTKGLL